MQHPVSFTQALVTIDKMQARIDALESAARQSGDTLWHLQSVFSLSPQSAKIVALLSAGAMKTHQQLYDVLNSGAPDWCPDVRLVNVKCSEIRKRMYSYGFDLETRWNLGKRLSGPLIDLRKAMSGELLTLKVVRGMYVPPKSSRFLVFEDTIAAKLLSLLKGRFQSEETFELHAVPVSKELGVRKQSMTVAAKRLCELGYLDLMLKGMGRYKFPVYKLNKLEEKVA